jgi:hypothetical protein
VDLEGGQNRFTEVHPSGRGGAGVAQILACVVAGGVADRAHIPQMRGGAHGQFIACS